MNLKKIKIFILSIFSLSFIMFSSSFQTAILSITYASCQKQTILAAPNSLTNFSSEQPASTKPMLQWTKVEGAVAYELELLYTPAKNQSQSETDPNCFFSTRYIYTNGFNADLSENFAGDCFYWRVRGLNIDGAPISLFSNPEKVCVDRQLEILQKPVPTSIFNLANGSTLLYPVYAWLPIAGASKYEVEILSALPENPNGTEPSVNRIDVLTATGFDCYDEQPRFSDQPFYWRVRGLDDMGNPIGVYSDAEKFVITPDANISVATYGDSITHGGGSVSYSPADWEYSYQNYLTFPTMNLGRSGDTSRAMVERFDTDVLPFKPKYLLILAGTNSIRGGTSATEVIADLKILKGKCLDNNILPVFLTLPPINPENIEKIFNETTASDWQLQRRLVNEYIRSQVYIDICPNMEDSNGNLKGHLAVDRLHPDIAGKKRIAQAINKNWAQILNLPWYAWLK